MQRPSSLIECPAKRQRLAADVEAVDAAECSSVSPMQPHLLHQALPQHIQEQHIIKQRMAPSTVVEHVLERTLCDADAALHLTLHAMSLATKIYECGTPDAADRALTIAEQALAATLQQLARAQTLVAHKALQQQQQQQGFAAEEEDADLQDTCSSSYSVSTSSTEMV